MFLSGDSRAPPRSVRALAVPGDTEPAPSPPEKQRDVCRIKRVSCAPFPPGSPRRGAEGRLPALRGRGVSAVCPGCAPDVPAVSPRCARSAAAQPSPETRRGRDCHALHAPPPDVLFLRLKFARVSQEISPGALSAREDPQNLALMYLACW